jgi:hypothetical protein
VIFIIWPVLRSVEVLGNTASGEEKIMEMNRNTRQTCWKKKKLKRRVLKNGMEYKEIGDSSVRAEEKEINNRISFSV